MYNDYYLQEINSKLQTTNSNLSTIITNQQTIITNQQNQIQLLTTIIVSIIWLIVYRFIERMLKA